MPTRQKLIEESGPSVTHINISRSGRRRQRKKNVTQYDIHHTVLHDDELVEPAPPASSSNIDAVPAYTHAEYTPLSMETAWHTGNALDDNFVNGPSSDIPMSDGPELFNGLADPEMTTEHDNADALSAASEELLHEIDPKGGNSRRHRSTAIEQWLPLRQEYLERLMMRNAKGNGRGCSTCSVELGVNERYRCVECKGKEHKCTGCILEAHACHPYHRLQKWSGRYWEKASLHDLGYEFHLRHRHEHCQNPLKRETMTILHLNGFHRLSTVFCGCLQEVRDMEPRCQLLDEDLYPASSISPSSAFTIECLDVLLKLSSQSSISIYDFYQSMRQVTDNIDVSNWPKRYDELAHVIRCYRHLKMLLQAGRCHDPKGAAATQAGELAMGCPACPHPGKNLPPDYASAPYWKQFLYQLFWAMDANFRLKRKLRGTRDVIYLSPDWGYFVHPDDHEHERNRAEAAVEKEKEPHNTCDSTFAAIERANSKGVDGYATTGVGAVICSRHGFLCPSIVNLTKGERQLDMDLGVLSSVRCTESGNVIIRLTYDIVCRWGLRLWHRIPLFQPKYSQPVVGRTFILGIPKFHLPGHGRACHSRWSLNYRTGWARTDGEGIERFWSIVNRFATASREMTTGNRHDYLDYQIGASNFRKLCALGTLLYGKLKDAVEKIEEHTIVLNELEESCGAERVESWKKQVTAWQDDHSVKPDPYQEGIEATTSNSLAQLRKEMAKEDAQSLDDINSPDANESTMTATAFILQGLELEASQYSLRTAAIKTRHTRLTEEAKVEEKRTSLLRKIRKWVNAQAIHMPHAFALRHSESSSNDILQASHPSLVDDDDDDETVFGADDESVVGDEQPAALPSGVLAEDYKLYLPSALPDDLFQATASHLKEKEARIRLTVLESTLNELCRLLRVKMGIVTNKRSFVVGQKGNTRTQKLLGDFSEKIDNTAERYRQIRASLLKLDPNGSWVTRLHPLEKSDVRMPQEDFDPDDKKKARKKKKRKLGEGKRLISWIWRVSDISNGDGEDDESNFRTAMRVEWAKAEARVKRWIEEKELVMEEMRRTPWYLDWKAQWWESLADARSDSDSDLLRDGCAAYAAKQADVNRALARKFALMWKPLLDKHGLCLLGEWPSYC